jgi:hypothetical protein
MDLALVPRPKDWRCWRLYGHASWCSSVSKVTDYGFDSHFSFCLYIQTIFRASPASYAVDTEYIVRWWWNLIHGNPKKSIWFHQSLRCEILYFHLLFAQSASDESIMWRYAHLSSCFICETTELVKTRTRSQVNFHFYAYLHNITHTEIEVHLFCQKQCYILKTGMWHQT